MSGSYQNPFALNHYLFLLLPYAVLESFLSKLNYPQLHLPNNIDIVYLDGSVIRRCHRNVCTSSTTQILYTLLLKFAMITTDVLILQVDIFVVFA